jgi:hypothetical protein
MLATFEDAEEQFSHAHRGLFDDFHATNLRRNFKVPIFRAGWKWARERFSREFVEFIDKMVDETPVAAYDPGKSLAEWNADMSAEAAKAAA